MSYDTTERETDETPRQESQTVAARMGRFLGALIGLNPLQPPGSTQGRLNYLRRRRRYLTLLEERTEHRVICIAVLAPLFAGLAVVGVLRDAETLATVGGLPFVVLLVAGLIISAGLRRIRRELSDISHEMDLLESEGQTGGEKSERALQVNQLHLKQYYDQTLRQGRNIFYVGLLCIAVGFAIVGAAFPLVLGAGDDTTEKIVIATLGGVSGILANFVALIYLKMFSDTIQSVGQFHNRLVATHKLYFANYLAAQVGDKDKREDALAAMAESLVDGETAESPAEMLGAQNGAAPSAQSAPAGP